MLDHPRDGGAVERAQAVAPEDGGHQPREGHVGRLVAGHVVLEVDGDLEQFAEVGVAMPQQVVEQPLAH